MNQATNDIYSKAESELRDIDRQIASLAKRKAELTEFVALGRRLFNIGAVTPPTTAATFLERLTEISEKFVEQRSRENSMKARVLDLASNAIRMHGPLTTARLVELLEATGLEITGKDKNVTVSVILSRSQDFVSDRTKGWSLAEKSPQDAPTSTGSLPAQAGLQLNAPDQGTTRK